MVSSDCCASTTLRLGSRHREIAQHTLKALEPRRTIGVLWQQAAVELGSQLQDASEPLLVSALGLRSDHAHSVVDGGDRLVHQPGPLLVWGCVAIPLRIEKRYFD